MNKFLLSLAISGLFLTVSTSTMASTAPYYALGEDIENIINGDEASIVVQLEEKILSFSLFRKLHGYFFNVQYLSNESTEEDDDEYVSELDDSGGCQK